MVAWLIPAGPTARQFVPPHRPHAIAYLAGSDRGGKPTTSEKIRKLHVVEHRGALPDKPKRELSRFG